MPVALSIIQSSREDRPILVHPYQGNRGKWGFDLAFSDPELGRDSVFAHTPDVYVDEKTAMDAAAETLQILRSKSPRALESHIIPLTSLVDGAPKSFVSKQF